MQFIATHVLCSVTTLCMSVCKQLNTGLACEWCRTTTWKLTVCGLALHHKWNQGHPPHHTAQVTSRLAGQRQRLETVGPSLLWALQLIPLPRFYVRLLGHSARSRVPWRWESCRQAPYCPGFCSKSLTVVTSDYVFSDSVYQQSYCAVSIVCYKHHKMAECPVGSTRVAGGFAAEVGHRRQISINNCCYRMTCRPCQFWSHCDKVQHTCWQSYWWIFLLN